MKMEMEIDKRIKLMHNWKIYLFLKTAPLLIGMLLLLLELDYLFGAVALVRCRIATLLTELTATAVYCAVQLYLRGKVLKWLISTAAGLGLGVMFCIVVASLCGQVPLHHYLRALLVWMILFVLWFVSLARISYLKRVDDILGNLYAKKEQMPKT